VADKTADALATALQHHQAGRYEAAARIYRRVLKRQPGNANALNLLGLLAHQEGRHGEAERLIGRAVARLPTSALFRRNLAAVQQANGDLAAAAQSYAEAGELAPADAEILNDRGTVLIALGRFSDAVTCFQRATALAPGSAVIQYNLGNALLKRGDHDRAVEAFRQAVASDSDMMRAQHMLNALTGAHSDRPPDDYVRHLFDDYAARFDTDLVDNLDYRVPEKLRTLLLSVRPAPHFAAALDLGCGTGLSGAAFRDLTDDLTGVDLSPGMIAKAAERDIYDMLAVAPLAEFWRDCDRTFDLFLATDVFIYVGDLEATFAEVIRHARDGAVFAFSTERCPGDGFRLQPSGRYAHETAYIDGLAAAHGFAVLARQAIDIRKGDDGPVLGDAVILTKNAG